MRGRDLNLGDEHGEERMWDLQLSVHCLKPTSKKSVFTPQMGRELKATARKAVELESGLKEAKAKHAKLMNDFMARLAVSKREIDRLRAQHAAALAQAEALQKTYERDHKAVHDAVDNKEMGSGHTPETIRAAWRAVLEPLRARLQTLHDERFVESGVVGFLRSDAEDSWRKFWTQTDEWTQAGETSAAGSGNGGSRGCDRSGSASDRATREPLVTRRVPCVAPFARCRCAHCTARGGDVDRSAAKASGGTSGVFLEPGKKTMGSGDSRDEGAALTPRDGDE
jgi:hypothetical protein